MSETAVVIEEDSKTTKVTEKAPRTRGLLPLIADIKPRFNMFAKAYVNNGGNSTKAYEAATGNLKASMGTKASMANKWLNRNDVRQSVLYHMELYGGGEEAVSKRVASMLHSTDPWVADRGITHSRAILGLDAPSESHIQVDKRSINITCTANEAKSLMKELINKSK